MKKTLQMLAAAVVLTTASVAQAQGGGGGGRGGNMQERMAQQRAMMFEGITLTAEQTTKIDSISATARKAQMELMAGMQQGGGQMPPELREKRTAITTKERADIKALLTKEQGEQFDKNVAAMGNGRRGNGLI